MEPADDANESLGGSGSALTDPIVDDNADLMSDWLLGDMDGPALDYPDPLETSAGQAPDAPGDDSSVGQKRDRPSEKAVECTDLSGNVIQVYATATIASQKLGIGLSDIALCLRGSKPHINGKKFRYVDDTVDEDRKVKFKRGYGLAPEAPKQDVPQITRTTRASRGEYGLNRFEEPQRSILAPPELKSRRWHQEAVSVGPFAIKKWFPNAPTPSDALQQHKQRVLEGAANLRKGNRRRGN